MITIDLDEDREHNLKLIKAALLNSISPAFKVKIPREFQLVASECIEKVTKFYKLIQYDSKHADEYNGANDTSNVIDSCVSCYLTSDLEPCSSNIRQEFYTLTKKILDIMFSDSNFDVNEHLKEKGAAIGGNITVRFYPKGGKGVLGSHVDGNFMTFLFSNGQGLEILKDDVSVSPKAIKEFGVPSLTPTLINLSDSDWYSISQDDSCVVVTVGNSFFEESFVKSSVFSEVQCPTLHRVQRKSKYDRFSIPFLFDFESVVDLSVQLHYQTNLNGTTRCFLLSIKNTRRRQCAHNALSTGGRNVDR